MPRMRDTAKHETLLWTFATAAAYGLDEYRDCFEAVEFAVFHTVHETENFKAFQEEFRGVA